MGEKGLPDSLLGNVYAFVRRLLGRIRLLAALLIFLSDGS